MEKLIEWDNFPNDSQIYEQFGGSLCVCYLDKLSCSETCAIQLFLFLQFVWEVKGCDDWDEWAVVTFSSPIPCHHNYQTVDDDLFSSGRIIRKIANGKRMDSWRFGIFLLWIIVEFFISVQLFELFDEIILKSHVFFETKDKWAESIFYQQRTPVVKHIFIKSTEFAEGPKERFEWQWDWFTIMKFAFSISSGCFWFSGNLCLLSNIKLGFASSFRFENSF